MVTSRADIHAHVEDILRQEGIADCLVEAVMKGCREALERHNHDRPPNDLGVQRFGSIVESATRWLRGMGFYRNDRGCQVRLESLDSRFSSPVRIGLCRGADLNFHMRIRVNRKGEFSRLLIEENEPYIPQLALFTLGEQEELAEDAQAFMNCWVVWDVRGDEVAIKLVLPVDLSRSGTVMTCSEMITLHEGAISEPHASADDIPEGATLMPVIEELEINDEERGK